MKYSEDKVYTALNAEELKPGSRIIVADTISELKCKVEHYGEVIWGSPIKAWPLKRVCADTMKARFAIDIKGNGDETVYLLAYLVQAAKYRPFKNTAELIDYLGTKLIWVTDGETEHMIVGSTQDTVSVAHSWYSMQRLFEDWKFADGSPCGVPEYDG